MKRVEPELAVLLRQLEEQLRAFGAPIAEALQPGLPEDAIRAALAAEGLRTPAELVDWWGWHDGAGVVEPVDGVGVFKVPENRILNAAHLMSLNDSLRDRRWMRRLYDEELGWPDGYPIGWLPILEGAGVSYCADTLADDQVALVYMYEYGGGTPYPPQPQFGSIADLVGALVRIFDRGEVRRDPEDPRLPSLPWPTESDEARALVTWPSA